MSEKYFFDLIIKMFSIDLRKGRIMFSVDLRKGRTMFSVDLRI